MLRMNIHVLGSYWNDNGTNRCSNISTKLTSCVHLEIDSEITKSYPEDSRFLLRRHRGWDGLFPGNGWTKPNTIIVHNLLDKVNRIAFNKRPDYLMQNGMTNQKRSYSACAILYFEIGYPNPSCIDKKGNVMTMVTQSQELGSGGKHYQSRCAW